MVGKLQTLPLLALVFVFWLSSAVPAWADGGEPRLEISVERSNPGGMVDVRGVDLEPEEMVAVALIGNELVVPMDEVVADPEGVFLMSVTLPADLVEGEYTLRAVTDDHQMMSPALTVSGAAITDNEEGQRDESESLLASMPTPQAVTPASADSAQEAETGGASSNTSSLVLAIVLIAGGIALFSWMRLRRAAGGSEESTAG